MSNYYYTQPPPHPPNHEQQQQQQEQQVSAGPQPQQQIHNNQEVDSDSLWDELSHEQSREILAHHERIQQQRQQQQGNYLQSNSSLSSRTHGRNVIHPQDHRDASTFHSLNHGIRGGFGIQVNLPAWETHKIKQAVSDTATKIASVARHARESAQRNLALDPSHAKAGESNVMDEPYVGPYAKISSDTIRGRFGNSVGGRRWNQVNSPFDDFGLRESLMNVVEKVEHSSSEDDAFKYSHTDPLLEHDYCGMDEEFRAPLPGGVADGSSRSCSGHGVSHPSGMSGSGEDRRFVLLETFRVKKEGWGAVPNLDLFFASLYNYYYYRGIVPIIGKGIVELISLFFTLWLSVFLFQYLDWKGLWECRDEETCRDTLSSYILEKPFHKVSVWNFLMVLYIILFSAYGVFSISTFVTNMKDAMHAKYIFEDKLGISARKLEGGAVEWHEIVNKMLELQRSGEYRVAIHGQDIKDELVVAQRIMRRENFMIAFFNQDILDLTIPIPWKVGTRSRMKFYSKSIEWSIYFCVLSYMFNHKYKIRPAFYMDAASLQRRFVICGIAHAVFMPFLLFFLILHFFLQNLYDFRSSKQYLGPREWSNVAKWTFREFNELPHAFERRLEPSYQDAEDYLKLFIPSSWFTSLGRVLVFLSGSLGAVCVALAAVNDAILLHVKIWNWNLLWYVGILGVAYSVGKGMLPDNTVIPKYHHNLFAEMDAALMKVSNHTHYYPEFWKKRGWDDIVKSAFSELFQYKVKLFLFEVVSIIVAPIVLCQSLPNCAYRICSFVQKVKAEISGAGDHCGFATFDFDLFEDESWEGKQEVSTRTNITSSVGSTYPVFSTLYTTERPKTKMGKMEKSFFNFKTVHPDWKCAASGQNLVNRMEHYQNEQALAIATERQHHIAAAARQLALLRELELQNTEVASGDINLNADQINEHYVQVDYKPKSVSASVEQNSNDVDAMNHYAVEPPEELKGDKSYPRVQFKDLPPTSRQPTSRTLSKSNLSVLASVLRYDDAGLSAELNGLLNRSTLDPGVSLLTPGGFSQSLPHFEPLQSYREEGDDDSREQLLQRQYMWLEKYHSQSRPQYP